MDGKILTQIVDRIIAERGISRVELCEAIGITSAAYTGWKKGAKPREDKIIAIEKYLNIDLSDYEKSDTIDSDTADLLQSIRERQDLRILLHSAKDAPASSVYALISQIEKMKEESQ
jgi:transcriptional regulator with XRE-family HTH domain